MKRARLIDILDAYGADPARWPDVEREAAQALLARSAEAARAVAEARRLDALLDRAPPITLDLDATALAAAASAAPQRRRRGNRSAGWSGFGWPRFAGLAACALAGFIVGWSGFELGSQAEIADLEQLLVMEDLAPW